MENRKNSLFNVLHDEARVEACKEGFTSLLKLVSASFAEELASDATRCIYQLRSTYSRLNKVQRREWVTAFKKHKEAVAGHCADLIRESVINKVSNPVIGVYRSRITFYDGAEVSESSIEPRSFWPAYRLLRYANLTEDSNQLNTVLEIVCTVFSLCKDFALTEEAIDEDILKQIEEIQSTELRDSSKSYMEEIEVTLSLIKRAFEGDSKVLEEHPYLSDFVAALKETKKGFVRPTLGPENLKMSSASSGTTLRGYGSTLGFKGKGDTLPGNIASVFEGGNSEEFSEFDTLTGYTDKGIPESLVPGGIRSRSNYSVAIPQKKDSMRLIHIFSNPYQDRMTYFELIAKRLIRFLRADCTNDQLKGRRSMLKWMRMRKAKALYSLDLHAATNTLDISAQDRVTRFLLELLGYTEHEIDVLMDVYNRAMKKSTSIVLPHSKKKVKFSFSTGQPMGLTYSFLSFALTHHIAVLTAIRLSKVRVIGYHIVGDDLVVCIEEDPGMDFPRIYKEIMASLNTECNLDKGYIYNADVPGRELKIAEFCKFLICEGYDITPIPLNCLSHADTAMGRMVLLGWFQQHSNGGKLSPEKVAQFCGLTDEEKMSVALLSLIPVENLFNSEKGNLKMGQPASSHDVRIMTAATAAFIDQSLTLTQLMEVNRDSDYIPKYSDYKSFRSWKLRRVFRKILSPEYRDLVKHNKFINFIDSLELKALGMGMSLAQLLNGVLPEDDLLEFIPSLAKIDPSDIVSVVEFKSTLEGLIDDLEDGQGVTPAYTDEELELLLDSISKVGMWSVSSTNHRFGPLDRQNQGFCLHEFYERFQEMCKKLMVTDHHFSGFLSRLNEIYRVFGQTVLAWPTEFKESSVQYEESDDVTMDEDYDPWDILGTV